jgi:hypothetical protein
VDLQAKRDANHEDEPLSSPSPMISIAAADISALQKLAAEYFQQ